MKVRNGLGASLFATLLSAAAVGAQAPATPDIQEFIVTAKYPASLGTDELDVTPMQPAPFITAEVFDATSMLKQLHAAQGRSLLDAIAMLPDEESSQ